MHQGLIIYIANVKIHMAIDIYIYIYTCLRTQVARISLKVATLSTNSRTIGRHYASPSSPQKRNSDAKQSQINYIKLAVALLLQYGTKTSIKAVVTVGNKEFSLSEENMIVRVVIVKRHHINFIL